MELMQFTLTYVCACDFWLLSSLLLSALSLSYWLLSYSLLSYSRLSYPLLYYSLLSYSLLSYSLLSYSLLSTPFSLLSYSPLSCSLLSFRLLSGRSVYEASNDSVDKHGGNMYRHAVFNALSHGDEAVALCALALFHNCIINKFIADDVLIEADILPCR